MCQVYVLTRTSPLNGRGWKCLDLHLDDSVEVDKLAEIVPFDRARLRLLRSGQQPQRRQLSDHLGLHVSILADGIDCP